MISLKTKEEAKKILGLDSSEIKELLTKIHDLGPEIVIVTDGPKGAYTYDGNEYLFMPPYPDPKAPYERTGAGDAFACGFLSALMNGQNVKQAMRWGSANSASVVQKIGGQAGLLNKNEILKFLKNNPEPQAKII